MKSLDGVNKKNDVNNTASEATEKNDKRTYAREKLISYAFKNRPFGVDGNGCELSLIHISFNSAAVFPKGYPFPFNFS